MTSYDYKFCKFQNVINKNYLDFRVDSRWKVSDIFESAMKLSAWRVEKWQYRNNVLEWNRDRTCSCLQKVHSPVSFFFFFFSSLGLALPLSFHKYQILWTRTPNILSVASSSTGDMFSAPSWLPLPLTLRTKSRLSSTAPLKILKWTSEVIPITSTASWRWAYGYRDRSESCTSLLAFLKAPVSRDINIVAWWTTTMLFLPHLVLHPLFLKKRCVLLSWAPQNQA